jgi:hypothetical protein
MFLSAVSVLVVVQLSSEVLEVFMNKSVWWFTDLQTLNLKKCVIIICFCLLLSNYLTDIFKYSFIFYFVLYFCSLFCVFYIFVLFCVLSLHL